MIEQLLQKYELFGNQFAALRRQPQAAKWNELLPYESAVSSEEQGALFLLKNGALGCAWRLTPLSHELLDLDTLTSRLNEVLRGLKGAVGHHSSVQIISRCVPASPRCPNWIESGDQIAHELVREQFDYLASLSTNADVPHLQRDLYLTLMLESASFSLPGSLDRAEHQARNLFAERKEVLLDSARVLETGLRQARMSFSPVTEYELLAWVREDLSSLCARRERLGFYEFPFPQAEFLSESIALEPATLEPERVVLGDEEVLRVLSWAQVSSRPTLGMCASAFLALSIPHTLVLNLTRRDNTSDLSTKSFLLSSVNKGPRLRQKGEVGHAIDSMETEPLWDVSLHMAFRERLETFQKRTAKLIMNHLFATTSIPWVEETVVAPMAFLSTLPFGFSKDMAAFLQRGRTVLHAHLAPYLPLLGGFQGTGPSPGAHFLSRTGELISIDTRQYAQQNISNSHIAVLGVSGAGKSFLSNYLLMCDLAIHDSYAFIIDNKTSYELLARVLGHEHAGAAKFMVPPESFPNVFEGDITPERAQFIARILATGFELVTERKLENIEMTVLTEAIVVTAHEAKVHAQSRFSPGEFVGGAISFESDQIVFTPTLAQVMENLPLVCDKLGVPVDIARALRTHLLPFYARNGEFSKLFNQQTPQDPHFRTPRITICDLAGTTGIGRTLTTQIMIAEFLRLLDLPENRGRLSTLMIDEAGILLADGGSALADFVVDAWVTMRRKGVACIGLTNMVEHYQKLRGPRAIWTISDTKYLLVADETVAKAVALGKVDETGAVQPPLLEVPEYARLIPALGKKPGLFADILLHSRIHQGTFTFTPCGLLYWVSASHELEKKTFFSVRDRLNRMENPELEAAKRLGAIYPSGVRDRHGAVRALSESELAHLIGDAV